MMSKNYISSVKKLRHRKKITEGAKNGDMKMTLFGLQQKWIMEIVKL
jgi:hypothetical protein